MRRVPVTALGAPGDRLEIEPRSSHHLLTVLRTKRGAAVVAFDGAGAEASATLVDVVHGAAVLEQTSVVRRPAPQAPLHLLIGVPKKPAMDLATRMATEIGISDLHPILCARTVAKGDHGPRWARIAEAAAKQCGRPDLPTIHPLSNLGTALARMPEGVDGRVGVLGGPALQPASGAAAVLIGPEGGLTTAEIDQAIAAGFTAVTVARWTLRTDTAVAALLCATAGGPTWPSS